MAVHLPTAVEYKKFTSKFLEPSLLQVILFEFQAPVGSDTGIRSSPQIQ